MKRMLLILALAVSARAESFAIVRGHISDQDNTPLPGVDVTLTGAPLAKPLTAVTNEHGDFVLFAVPPGSRYELGIKLLGFTEKRGELGGIGANESLFVAGAMNTARYSGCGVIWWNIDRRGSNPTFIEPLPRAPVHYICL